MKKRLIVGFFVLSFIFTFVHISHAQSKNEPALSGEIRDGVRVVYVVAFQYGFSPDPIVVAKNDRVKLILTTKDVRHGFAVREYNINTIIEPGKTNEVEFISDKQGEFVVECSVYCGSGHMHMKAKLIVK